MSFKIPLTPPQFNAKADQLRREQGISLDTYRGQASKSGVTLGYDYDGQNLTIDIVKKPFFLSAAKVQSIVSGWLNAAIVLFAVLLCLAVPMKAQQGIANLYMAGLSAQPGASPAIAGTALYAHQINTSGTYAFTLIDALPASVKPFAVNTNIGIGIAQRIATIAGRDIFVPTAAGISWNGPNTGWAWSTGVGVPIQYKTTHWYAMPTVRILKSSVSGGSDIQPIFGVLIGTGQ
ncbi:MAG TPA: hypothetical protein VLI45_09155 [Acidobacteriaceae bacterium]|nr:hypothetical protein [Acidobacteriaceae bacterium]